MKQADIGLIGLGVMGANFARNMSGKNFTVTVYNRTSQKTDEFLELHGNDFLQGTKDISDFIQSLKRPRAVVILVNAGSAVDEVLSDLTPLLERGDTVVECGNSHYKDTQRRCGLLEERGMHFIGCGISGGESGALHGPSLMPGGDKAGFEQVKNIFEAVAAKDFQDKPCMSYIGENGAGHYVKMVHNGIEYGVMQLMAEAYELLRKMYGLSAPEIAKIFQGFQKGVLQSYLLEIAISVLEKKDTLTDGFLIDHILDKAAQKGTGMWTVSDALERGVAVPTIAEAVFARVISGEKEQRENLSSSYSGDEKTEQPLALDSFITALEQALYVGVLSVYAQGYSLIRKAAAEENWNVDLGEISRIWQGGCIIRAKLLSVLHAEYLKNKDAMHVLAMPDVVDAVRKSRESASYVLDIAFKSKVVVPTLASAVSYVDGMIVRDGSANLIQGLRDYFGAHTYERNDRFGTFHTDWESL